MGKQTQRRHAKQRRNADASSTDLCCLPHCEEPGTARKCGHILCGMDLLKLLRFADGNKCFVLNCPMCRTESIVDDDIVAHHMDKLPFRCANFRCFCSNPDCTTYAVMTLLPCKRHQSYVCDACVGLGDEGPRFSTSLRVGP